LSQGLTQLGYGFCYVGKPLLRKAQDERFLNWKVSVEHCLCTLQEAFEKVDLFIGLNIELKFDDEIQYTEDQLRHILQVILEVRNESFHNLIEHRNRRQTVDGQYL
jgi:hypothetical protein